MGALVALAVLSLLLATIGWHFVTNRRLAQRREHQLQAAALARAGVELAVGRLLTDPEKYTGESVTLLPQSQVSIKVEREPGTPDTFRVVSEARYPTDTPETVLRALTRCVRRHPDGPRVRVEVTD
jgi:type II secretory pathway pseudopilin PulG